MSPSTRLDGVLSVVGRLEQLNDYAVAVVERDLSDEQREQVRQLLLAVGRGAIPDRGDSVVYRRRC